MEIEKGITVTVPQDGFEVEKIASGLRLRPVAWRDSRYPESILLEVRDTEPAGLFPKQRALETGEAHYRIDTAEGGSGGEEITLHAWLAVGKRIFYLRHTLQSEDRREAEFDRGWRLLGSARVAG